MSIPAYLQLINNAPCRKSVVALIKEANTEGKIHCPILGDLALHRIFADFNAPDLKSQQQKYIDAQIDPVDDESYSDEPVKQSTSTKLNKEPEFSNSDALEILESAQSVLTSNFIKPNLVFTSKAWHAAMELAVSHQKIKTNSTTKMSNTGKDVISVFKEYVLNPDITPDSYMSFMYTSAMNATNLTNPYQQISQAFNQALANPIMDDHYLVSIYSSAIHAQLRTLKDLPSALQTYTQLFSKHRLVPNKYALSALIQHIVQQGQKSTFSKIMTDLQVNNHDLYVKGLNVDHLLANQIVRGIIMFQGLDAAIKFILDLMRPVWGLDPDSVTYGYIIESAINAGDYDRAKFVLSQIHHQGLHVGWHAFRPFIVKAAREQNFNMIAMTLACIQNNQSDFEKDMNRLMDVVTLELAKTNNFELVDQVIAQIVNPSVSIFNAYLSSLLNKSVADPQDLRINRALKIYNETIPAHGLVPDHATLHIMIAALAHRAKFEAAINLIRQTSLPVSNRTFQPLLKGAAKRFDTQIFLVLENMMINEFQLTLDADGLDAKVACYARANKYESAIEAAKLMHLKKYQPSLTTHLAIISGYVNQLKQCQQSDTRAIKVALDTLIERVANYPSHTRESLDRLLHILGYELSRPNQVLDTYMIHADTVRVTGSISARVLMSAKIARCPATAQVLVNKWTSKYNFVMSPQNHCLYLEVLANAGWINQALMHVRNDMDPSIVDETHISAVVQPLIDAGQHISAIKIKSHFYRLFPNLYNNSSSIRTSNRGVVPAYHGSKFNFISK